MHLQVLSSGSGGNSALLRAGDTGLLVDAGLGLADMEQRLEAARVGPEGIHHVYVTHGHLDHARSAGRIARKHRATLHCAEALMRNASIRRAGRFATLAIGPTEEIEGPRGSDDLRIRAVPLPHDASPTVAFRIEHGGRAAAIVTDMGCPRDEVARALAGVHVLVLEFNHDEPMLANGPYPDSLKRRIAGDGGHLSNAQAAWMLRRLASANLHTLVLAHLSQHNNTRELALGAALETLASLGLSRVRVLVGRQDEPLENLEV